MMLLALVIQADLASRTDKPSYVVLTDMVVDEQRALAIHTFYGAEPGDLIYIPTLHWPAPGHIHILPCWSETLEGETVGCTPDPRLAYYIMEGHEGQSLATGQRPAHIYLERHYVENPNFPNVETSRESGDDLGGLKAAALFHRPPIPSGKELPEEPIYRPHLESRDTFFATGPADDGVVLAALDVALVMERTSQTDEDWKFLTDGFRDHASSSPRLYHGDFFVHPVFDVTDAQVLLASNIVNWVLVALVVLVLVASAWWYGLGRHPGTEPASGLAPFVRIAQYSAEYLRGLVQASRINGILLTALTVLASLAVRWLVRSRDGIITDSSVESNLLLAPWLVGIASLIVWLQHHLRIRRTWQETKRIWSQTLALE